jgi:hypothetical protein
MVPVTNFVKIEIMKTDAGFSLGGMDKTVPSVGSLFDDEGDKLYWRALSPIERLRCLEMGLNSYFFPPICCKITFASP